MVLTNYIDGQALTESNLDDNENTILRQTGLNSIRQLIDRDIDINAKGGEFVEAYIDANGRKNSISSAAVSLTKTTATFNTDKFECIAIPTGSNADHDPNSVPNYANIFDGNDATFSSASFSSGTRSAGKLFERAYLTDTVDTKVKIRNNTSGYNSRVWLEVFNGTSWFRMTILASAGSGGDSGDVTTSTDLTGMPCTGVRLSAEVDGSSRNTTFTFYTLDYTTSATTDQFNLLQHDIPSGTFSPTVSGLFGTTLFEDFEGDASADFKITNATEDSGWLNGDEKSNFTAFTSEPTKLIVRLNPTTTSPTSGFPSIKGVAVFE